MAEKLIPADVTLAAKRGFIRTASQSFAAALAVVGTITVVFTADFFLGALLGLAGAIATSIVSGAVSFFQIVSKGIPAEYATVNEPTEVSPLED